MGYTYDKHSSDELEQIADVVLSRYANRHDGFVVDIESIIEDCGITILPRRGLRRLVNGYIPKDPRFVVIDESYGTYLPTYRFILAEEFCHILLEYDLLKIKTIPDDAQPHLISFEQHKIIEEEAQYLARAILLPKKSLTLKWKEVLNGHSTNGHSTNGHSARDSHLINCVKALESVFRSYPLKIASRARDLNLISQEECSRCFFDRVQI